MIKNIFFNKNEKYRVNSKVQFLSHFLRGDKKFVIFF